MPQGMAAKRDARDSPWRHEQDGCSQAGKRPTQWASLAKTNAEMDPLRARVCDKVKLVAGGGSVLRVMLLSKTGKISIWEDNRENNFIQ